MSLNIAYIDDEEDLLEIFKEFYSDQNVNIKTYLQPQQALEVISENPGFFDVIFIDYRMPGMTGDQVAKKISKETPKYLISGELDVENNGLFLEILAKPTREEQIREILQKHLDQKEA